MKKLLIISVIAILFLTGTYAVLASSSKTLIYTVAVGDDLWSIAEKEWSVKLTRKVVDSLILMNPTLFPGGLQDSKISYRQAQWITANGVLHTDSSKNWRYAHIQPGDKVIIGYTNNLATKAGLLITNFLNGIKNLLYTIPPAVYGILLILVAMAAAGTYFFKRRRQSVATA